jgi:hypothetical protein
MSSGSDVVAAATMPPVSSSVSSRSTSSDRSTASAWLPRCLRRRDHFSQSRCVLRMRSTIPSRAGTGAHDGVQVTTSSTDSPADRVNRSRWAPSDALGSRSPRSSRESGPAIARIPGLPSASLVRLTHGLIAPYPNRTIHSCSNVTVPSRTSTRRTMSARSSAIGMHSTTTARPVGDT